MEGEVAQDEVLGWARRFAELGSSALRGFTLCDTTGMAHPLQVRRMAEMFMTHLPESELTFHFHDTRGMGLANILAAVQSGVTRFDSSLGGLGGCPYAPGASGNVCSEDAIHMLDAMGFDTGIELDRLIEISGGLPGLVGHDVPGQVAKAGRTGKRHPAPPWVAAFDNDLTRQESV